MRVYTVTAENQTVANAGGDVDLVEVSPADDKPCWFLGFTVDNAGGSSDAGDAQEEFYRAAIIRGHTSSGSGGSSATPVPLDPIDTAAGFSAEINNTTIASSGSTTTPWAGGIGNRLPGERFFGTPDNLWMCPKVSQANTTMVLRLLSTVADDITMNWTLWVCEA